MGDKDRFVEAFEKELENAPPVVEYSLDMYWLQYEDQLNLFRIRDALDENDPRLLPLEDISTKALDAVAKFNAKQFKVTKLGMERLYKKHAALIYALVDGQDLPESKDVSLNGTNCSICNLSGLELQVGISRRLQKNYNWVHGQSAFGSEIERGPVTIRANLRSDLYKQITTEPKNEVVVSVFQGVLYLGTSKEGDVLKYLFIDNTIDTTIISNDLQSREKLSSMIERFGISKVFLMSATKSKLVKSYDGKSSVSVRPRDKLDTRDSSVVNLKIEEFTPSMTEDFLNQQQFEFWDRACYQIALQKGWLSEGVFWQGGASDYMRLRLETTAKSKRIIRE